MSRFSARFDSDASDSADPVVPGDVEAGAPADRRDEHQAALEALFQREYDGLCDFAERYVRTEAVAEELVQDVFLRLWRRRSATPLETVTRAYLYASVRNAALQVLRHERVDLQWRAAQAVAPAPRPQAADAHLAAADLRLAAEAAIASLPERCRLVFTLSRQQGLRYSEIARALGISEGTVEIQMNRALKALRAKLAPYLVLLLVVLR